MTNRSQTIDSSGYLKLGYSRPIFQDAEFAADVYFDRAIYHGVYVYSPVAGLQTGCSQRRRFAWGRSWNKCQNYQDPCGKSTRRLLAVEFRDNLRQDQTNYNVNPFQPVLDDRQSTQEWAAFVEDEFTIRRVLILNAGLRTISISPLEEQPTRGLQLIYSPRRRTTLKLIYGQAFRAPNDYELYYSDHVSIEPNPYLSDGKNTHRGIYWEQDVGGGVFVSPPRVLAVNSPILSTQEVDPKTAFIDL